MSFIDDLANRVGLPVSEVRDALVQALLISDPAKRKAYIKHLSQVSGVPFGVVVSALAKLVAVVQSFAALVVGVVRLFQR